MGRTRENRSVNVLLYIYCENVTGLHLIAHVHVGVLGQQQRHQVHAALLRCQVNGADALPRHRVGVSAVLQQCGPDVHLVLFGSDVQRRVTVLRQTKHVQVQRLELSPGN